MAAADWELNALAKGGFNNPDGYEDNEIYVQMELDRGKRQMGLKHYELSNHLGNVLATVSDLPTGIDANEGGMDYYTAKVESAQDYYPLGCYRDAQSPKRQFTLAGGVGYRFGFQGQEQDDEVLGAGNALEFGGRGIYDPRLGRFKSIDPRWREFTNLSTYAYAGNNPIVFIDKNGEGPDQRILQFLENVINAHAKLYAKEQVQLNVDKMMRYVNGIPTSSDYIDDSRTSTIDLGGSLPLASKSKSITRRTEIETSGSSCILSNEFNILYARLSLKNDVASYQVHDIEFPEGEITGGTVGNISGYGVRLLNKNSSMEVLIVIMDGKSEQKRLEQLYNTTIDDFTNFYKKTMKNARFIDEFNALENERIMNANSRNELYDIEKNYDYNSAAWKEQLGKEQDYSNKLEKFSNKVKENN